MMTENPWPQTSDPYPADPYGTAGTATPSPAQEGATTKKDAVKEETANVAGQAAGAAQGVAETAKTEVANVASEAKTSAKDLLHQAKSNLTDQAGTQQQKAAEGIRSISSQLRTMADAPDQQGVASDLIHQAADRSESVASWLENRDPGSLLDEVKTFARQRPGTFLLLAAGAGLLAGRLGRSLQAGAPGSTAAAGTAVPPQATQTLAPESTLTSGAGGSLYGEPTTGVPAYGETAYGEPTVQGTRGTPAQTPPGSSTAGVPLRDVDDPYGEGEGRPL
ncbi:hypothetical protein [Arthrobacter sp. NPDC093139]|uniref:hypothetical protein n=1 Tax=Arthrobacter sp. NPDC093139 TaxID=3363945 RepID=UPI00381D9A58